jgi:hypothetical protein
VRAAISPSVHATDDASGTALVQASVDGGPAIPFKLVSGLTLDGIWSGPVALGADGPHTVVLWATDIEGNGGLTSPTATNPIILRLVTDTTPPVVSIGNVVEGTCYGAPVTPVVNATDTNLAVVDSRLDGAPFTLGATVSAEGDHTLLVQATDRAANQTSAQVRFVLDLTPPRIGIGGAVDGSFVAADVPWSVVVDEAHLTSLSLAVNGVSSGPTGTASAEGAYTVTAHATDCAGQATDAALHFTIDKTPPLLSIEGVFDGSYYRSEVVPTWSATDANLAGVTATLNGVAVASGMPLAADGNYLLDVAAVDKAGNRTGRSVAFVIDTKAPSITVSGLTEGEVTSHDVLPIVLVQDANIASWKTTVDGADFPVGGSVGSEGTHLLEVLATDLAGNAASTARHFEIDKTPPAIWASVKDGSSYADPVTVTFGATDRNLGDVTATLDGVPFQSGVRVETDGSHQLVVRAMDLAGNTATSTYKFEIQGVRYVVQKRLLDRAVRVLALLPCPPSKADRIEAFIRAALPGIPVTIVQTVVDLLVQLRTGVHDVVIISGRSDPVDSSCVPVSSSPPPLNAAALDTSAEQELTEAVFRGAGLVVFRDVTPAWPQLVEALGLRYQSNELQGVVSIQETAVARAARLTVPQGVQLKLTTATEIGQYDRDAGAAAATRSFGVGAAASFGFDLSLAQVPSDASGLLASAVDFVAPDVTPSPRGVVAVGIDVNSLRGAPSTHVTESVDSSLAILGASAGGQQPAYGTIEWRFDPVAGTTTSLSYLVRLPPAAGTFHTSTVVASASSAGVSVYGTYPLDIVLPRGEAEIAASAQALATTISDAGVDATRRKKILLMLASVASNSGTTATDREVAISTLLGAIDNVKALRTVDPTPLRLEIDALLATWEARQ